MDERSEYSRNRTSNNWFEQNCIREDLAKEKMVFSKESSRAVFEMGNVELICKGGKLMKPDQDVVNQTREAFEILKTPHYRTSQIATRGRKCGPNPWQQHTTKLGDAMRSATKGERALTSIWDRWQNDEIYRKSQLAHNWSDACAFSNIYHKAR